MLPRKTKERIISEKHIFKMASKDCDRANHSNNYEKIQMLINHPLNLPPERKNIHCVREKEVKIKTHKRKIQYTSNITSYKNKNDSKIGRLVSNKSLKKSSIYAVSQIGKADTQPRKCIWLIVLLVGFFGCSYQIHKFLKVYLTYPIVVSLQEEQSLILKFPAVTVCNLNRMKALYDKCKNSDFIESGCVSFQMVAYGYTIMRKNSVISERRSTLSCNVLFNGSFDQERDSKIKFLSKYMKIDSKNRRFIGQRASEIIKYCSFNSRVCSPDDFVYFQSLQYGNCYTFNSEGHNKKESLKTSSIGYRSGLELVLDLDLKEYMDVTSTVGLRVLVHDPTETPKPDDNGFVISPGFETSIALEQTLMRRLPAPYRDKCRDYKSLSDQHNEEECIKNCLQERSFEMCGCIDPTMTSKSNWSHCDMKNLTNVCCLDDVQDHIVESVPPCDCPVSCESTYYNEQLSNALWPSEATLFINTTDKDMMYLRQNRARLRVFYCTLAQNVYTQLPMFEGSEIFSHLGGELALWLGLSLFALFEVIEGFVYFCGNFRKFFVKNKK